VGYGRDARATVFGVGFRLVGVRCLRGEEASLFCFLIRVVSVVVVGLWGGCVYCSDGRLTAGSCGIG